MSDAYSLPDSDPDLAVATLGRALRELLDTFHASDPEHDADGGEHASWWLLLRPADDDQDDVVPPPPATTSTVTVSVAADATRIEVIHPAGTEADLSDDCAVDVIVEGSPYGLRLPAGSVRILTRLLMDLWHHEQQSRTPRGLCQLCGKGRALSLWRPR